MTPPMNITLLAIGGVLSALTGMIAIHETRQFSTAGYDKFGRIPIRAVHHGVIGAFATALSCVFVSVTVCITALKAGFSVPVTFVIAMIPMGVVLGTVFYLGSYPSLESALTHISDRC